MNDRLPAILLLVFSGLNLLVTKDYPAGSKILPVFIAIVVGLLTIPLLIKPIAADRFSPLARVATFLAVVVVSLLILHYLGFILFQLFLVIVGMLVQGQRSFSKISLCAIGVTGITYAFFIKLFQIPLPLFAL